MDRSDSIPSGELWDSDPFRFIKPHELGALGIDPADVPFGTFAALKHPPYLQSRFGGNAYGFGFFEIYHRVDPEDLKILHTVSWDNPRDLQRHHRKLNEIFKKIGLLIRFSSLGKPYYLIPSHLVSNTLSRIRAKIDEISKIISFHRKKYLQEHHHIGVVTQRDDLIAHELSLRFQEHQFFILDTLQSLREQNQTFDLVILTRDPRELLLTEKFSPLSLERSWKRRLEQYALYFLWKLYKLLKRGGEIFVIADHIQPPADADVKLTFQTPNEEKSFIVFTHVFKTQRRYQLTGHSVEVNVFDFYRYLSGLYVEEEVMKRLLGKRRVREMSLEELHNLPFVDLPLTNRLPLDAQEESWDQLFSLFFEKIFLKPLLPTFVKEEWKRRFSCAEYTPRYMLIYLGQKKSPKVSGRQLLEKVTQSKLSAYPYRFLAEYRNSFEYVSDTLQVLRKLKKRRYGHSTQTFISRLKQPLKNKEIRYRGLNNVIKLMGKARLLEKVRDSLNPDRLDGPRTKLIENLPALAFFGFSEEEMQEILYIVFGHSAMGRIISGKASEKALRPLTDLAKTYDPQQAVNLLRYCRLMTMAETEASKGSPLTQEQLTELFDLHEFTASIVVDRELDWEALLDERIISRGGTRNQVIRKVLKITNHFEFLDDWPELGKKGPMEKEALADYDDLRLSRIERVIRLVNTVDRFEKRYLQSDPLQLPYYYRKLLNMEFHGTGHVFGRMDTPLVYLLLWITVNVAKGEIINFNPLLADVDPDDTENRVKDIEKDAHSINLEHLDLHTLGQLSDQLYRDGFSFILGTGFALRTDPETLALEIQYLQLDRELGALENMCRRLSESSVSEIPVTDLQDLESYFSHLERFYQSHLRISGLNGRPLKLPERQKRWVAKVEELRKRLKSIFVHVLFRPESLYSDISRLSTHNPSLLNFVLPEFMALKKADLSGHLYLKPSVTDYIITCTKKFQALVRHEREHFQDRQLMYRLAHREFGPSAVGAMGVSDGKIEALEAILDSVRKDSALLEALTMTFIFQDIGRVPSLLKEYAKLVHQDNVAFTGAFFLEREAIAESYGLNLQAKSYLVFLVKYHSLIHHILRGEFSFSAIEEVLLHGTPELFDAFFLFSFIMLAALREDLMVEDLAGWLFWLRGLCHKILSGKTTLDTRMVRAFSNRGTLFFGLEAYRNKGLPKGIPLTDYLNSKSWTKREEGATINAGRMIFALERILRLRGIRYVGFTDIANLIIGVPLRFIYEKRGLSNIGYATFEKEVFEAVRIYNTLQDLPETTRHFILDTLVGDKVRIFGYEKASGYLSYPNQIKMLLIGLTAAKRLTGRKRPVSLSFMGLSEKIEKRYEAVNDFLNALPFQSISEDGGEIKYLHTAKWGLSLGIRKALDLVLVDFRDKINIKRKLSHMKKIQDIDQLKNYFHSTLQLLREYPFNSEDYELELEKGYQTRSAEIRELILEKTKHEIESMDSVKDLHDLVTDLLARALEIGFTEDQRHRLNDLYELRKDRLKSRKLDEIDRRLDRLQDARELKDYWDEIKQYLQRNRLYTGKEFETLVARKFDETAKKLPSPAPA